MNQKNQKHLFISACLLTIFGLWTMAVCLVDVQAIGPQESAVGFATMNHYFHRFTGVHMFLYTITDWLSLVPLMLAAGFSVLGLAQWIHRKHMLKVDRNILVLGGFYIVVIAVFILFELFAVNYRSVLIEGILEASYPSSTTMLVMCVMPTARMQLDAHIKKHSIRRYARLAIDVFTAFMVIGRMVSGVHWISDIIGGALLSAGLVMAYRAFSNV